MKTYIISYDLLKPGQDYTDLHKEIKSLADGYAKPLESFWIINSSLTAGQIRDKLKAHVDPNDKLFVSTVGSSWAGFNLGDSIYDWLKKNWKSDAKVA